MRVVLADLEGKRGFVSKDTVAGGYGSRLVPFSRTTRCVAYFKRRYQDVPSVQMAYLAAILADAGHEVVSTDEELVEGDVALVLSSLVDYRNETGWADAMRQRGFRVGFVGLAASKLPSLFADHSDFIIRGEPESATTRLAHGERLSGACLSEPVVNLDSLPFPRWDLVLRRRSRGVRFWQRPAGGAFPVMGSRGCPEFCTYCPHRIAGPFRKRSVRNLLDEVEELCGRARNPYILFRDPLFSQDRDRVLEVCDEVQRRGLRFSFECETRLDRVDRPVLQRMRAAGLRCLNFGVESVSPETVRKVGRRPIPPGQQRDVVAWCRELGVMTVGFFVLGFANDDWESVAATIEFAIELGPSLAQFKLMTPYPGTPLFRQLEPLIYERDWERFDGFTPTFHHPRLSAEELRFLLGAAYSRFYLRPSYVAGLLGPRHRRIREWASRLDGRVAERQSRLELRIMSRRVAC